MPELPEVEIVKRGLKKRIVNQQILKHEVLREKSFPNDKILAKKFLNKATITDVRRRAKILFIDLSSDYSLMIHLKMTGQLVYRTQGDSSFGAGHPNNSLISNLPDNSTRVVLALSQGQLFFNDQRVFGWMKLIPTAELANLDIIRSLGPEPLKKEFTYELFTNQIERRKNSGIKSVLLDQKIIAGIGNIYADEALWLARINPETKVHELTIPAKKRLHKAIPKVLNEGISAGGSTDRNYVNAEGQKGSYLVFAKVFRRENLPCPSCGTPIEKIRVASRGTHICPNCQRKL